MFEDDGNEFVLRLPPAGEGNLVYLDLFSRLAHTLSLQILFAKCITTALVVLLRLVSTEWGCS